MPAPPVDIGTGHERRLTSGRAKVDQLPQRGLESVRSDAGRSLHAELARFRDAGEYEDAVKLLRGLQLNEPAPTPKATSTSLGVTAQSSGSKPLPLPRRQSALENLAHLTTPEGTMAGQPATPESLDAFERERVFWDDLIPWLPELFVDNNCNKRMVERAWKLDDASTSGLLKALEPRILDLAIERKPCEFLIDFYRGFPDHHRKELLNSLKPHLFKLALHEQGQHLVKTIIRQGQYLPEIARELAPHLDILAHNNVGCRVIDEVVKIAAPVDLSPFTPPLLESWDRMLATPSGAALAQILVQRAMPPERDRFLEHMVSPKPNGISKVYLALQGQNSHRVLQLLLLVAEGGLRDKLFAETERVLSIIVSQGTALWPEAEFRSLIGDYHNQKLGHAPPAAVSGPTRPLQPADGHVSQKFTHSTSERSGEGSSRRGIGPADPTPHPEERDAAIIAAQTAAADVAERIKRRKSRMRTREDEDKLRENILESGVRNLDEPIRGWSSTAGPLRAPEDPRASGSRYNHYVVRRAARDARRNEPTMGPRPDAAHFSGGGGTGEAWPGGGGRGGHRRGSGGPGGSGRRSTWTGPPQSDAGWTRTLTGGIERGGRGGRRGGGSDQGKGEWEDIA
ncbi:hypothetical protein JCM3770_003350 [Rhodotorula araucariae]